MAGLFISPSDCRWESNLTAEHRLRRRLRQATFCGEAAVESINRPTAVQVSLLAIGTNLSRASGWSRVGTREMSTASCQPNQTQKQQTMTNFFSPAPWLLRDTFPRPGEPHVMAATKMFWLFPPSDQILAFHQCLPPTSPRWTTLTSIEHRYS